MKIASICAALALVSLPALAEESSPQAPAKTFTLTQEQAADYARRLTVENEQLSKQFQVNAATLMALQAQQRPTSSSAPGAEDKKDGK